MTERGIGIAMVQSCGGGGACGGERWRGNGESKDPLPTTNEQRTQRGWELPHCGRICLSPSPFPYLCPPLPDFVFPSLTPCPVLSLPLLSARCAPLELRLGPVPLRTMHGTEGGRAAGRGTGVAVASASSVESSRASVHRVRCSLSVLFAERGAC